MQVFFFLNAAVLYRKILVKVVSYKVLDKDSVSADTKNRYIRTWIRIGVKKKPDWAVSNIIPKTLYIIITG